MSNRGVKELRIRLMAHQAPSAVSTAADWAQPGGQVRAETVARVCPPLVLFRQQQDFLLRQHCLPQLSEGVMAVNARLRGASNIANASATALIIRAKPTSWRQKLI